MTFSWVVGMMREEVIQICLREKVQILFTQ
jgi:hypothetical protein